MTTVDKAHELFMSFEGRSPRTIYEDRCRELNCKINSALSSQLSDAVNDFYKAETLDLKGNFFGSRGIFAVLPILQCQQRLKSVNLSGCGVADDGILELVEILQDHPRLREVDLSDNPTISVFSGKPLVRVCKLNVNIIAIHLGGTNIGANVDSVIRSVCSANRRQMEEYFTDHYFRLKDMFIGLDVDGSGWININTFVSSVVFPMIQEKLKDRIAETKPAKREDNCIDINTFMSLTYLTYKTKEDIERRISEMDDIVATTILRNWKTVLGVLKSRNIVCNELSKYRVRNELLSQQDAERLVESAIDTASNASELTAADLLRASKKLLPQAPRSGRKSSFYVHDTSKHWSLPSKVVQAAVNLVGGVPTGISCDRALGAVFDMKLETIKLSFLRRQFNNYAIPIEDTSLTTQEVVNMLDEYYDTVRVDKAFTTSEIESMCSEI